MKITQILTFAFLIGLVSNSYAQDFTIGNTTLTETEVAVGLQVPWEMLWGPDDHIWMTERRGRVQRMDPATGAYTEILNIQSQVNGNSGEPGMLGMCLHPNFDENPLVYIVYTKTGGTPRNKLVSFEWDGTELINETTLLDNLHAGGTHCGSRLLVTQDEKILMTLGDGWDWDTPQDLDESGGKTYRLNLDGSIPEDNPFPDSYVYTYGHRNHQGLCQAPDGKIYSSEHGWDVQDEFNLLEAGGNYGWPLVEGYCDNDFTNNAASEPSDCEEAGITEPLFGWKPPHALSDIVYYDHPAIPELQGSILMAVMRGFQSQSIYRGMFVLHLDEEGTGVTFDQSEDIFISNKGRIRDICIDPNTGAIYVATNGNNWPSQGPNQIFKYENESFSAVNEQVNEENLNIYPNPSSGNVKFEVSEHLLDGTYSVVSYDGKEVLKGNITSNTFEIEDGELIAGSYYVVVSSKLGSISRTFIVQ